MERNKGRFIAGIAPGRPAGIQNKITRSVKETVLVVFNSLQSDPKANLEAWAKEQPTEFYKIAAKLIPSDITGSIRVVKVGKDLAEDFSE